MLSYPESESRRQEDPRWSALERWYLGNRQGQLIRVYRQKGTGMRGLLLLLENRGQVERVFAKETWQDDFLRKIQGFAIDLGIFDDLAEHNVSLMAFRYHNAGDGHSAYGVSGLVTWFLSRFELWIQKGIPVDFVEPQVGLPLREMMEVSRYS